MKKNDPMFDIEDSEDVTLTENKATSDKLLKAKGVKKINAHKNEAGAKSPSEHKWHDTAWGKVIIGVIVGLIVAMIIWTLNNDSA